MYKISKMPLAVDIGYVGETGFRKLEIDMKDWMRLMPEGVPSIVCIRPGETKADAYVAVTTFADDVLTWVITAADIGTQEGEGEIQIWLEEEENSSVIKRGKSVKVKTRVNDAVNDPSPDTPTSQEAFIEQVTELKTAAVNAKTAAETAQGKAEDAQEAAEAAQAAAEAVNLHTAYIDETTGHWMTWDTEEGDYVDSEVDAQGPQGDPGTDATPDLITKDYSDLTFPVAKDTLCYHSGVLYKANQDISTSEAWTAAHWTATTIEAEQTLLKTAIQGKYEKPSGGIPSTDMTQAVQDSLSAADSALIGVGKSEERDGIVQTGDTATKNIASGKYVIWKGSLYTASSNIATGETLSLSNLSPVSDGGYNALLDKIGEQSDEMEVVFDYTVEEENTGNNMILNLTKPCKKITCYIISTGNHPTQYRIKANNYTLGYVNWTANNVRHVMIIYDCVNKFGLVMSSTGGKSTSGWAANNNYILSNAIDDVHSISTIELTRDDGNDLVFPIGTTIKIYGK